MSTVSLGLSRADRRTFDERGLIRLEGLILRRTAETLADRLWQELAQRHGVRRDDASTWLKERPAQFGPLQKTGAFNAMATPELRALLDDLIGPSDWDEPKAWGLPLVCFPTAERPWALPHQVWHFDLTPDPSGAAAVGRVFVLLAPLRAGGGGTLVATGSHRVAIDLVQRLDAHLSSLELRQRLAAEQPWFAELMSPPKPGEDRIARFMGAATVVDGVELQVEEMTGEPGDVFLMHPHALHDGSSNVLDTPRLALTQFVYGKGRT